MSSDKVLQIIKRIQIKLDRNDMRRLHHPTVEQVAVDIWEQIKNENAVPDGLQVLTFAAIKLRDMLVTTNWKYQEFPIYPAFYADSNNVADHEKKYEAHIHALKEVYPLADVGSEIGAPTVVSALCEGLLDVATLFVATGEKGVFNSCEHGDGDSHITLVVPVSADLELTTGSYEAVYDQAKGVMEKTKLDKHGKEIFSTFFAMLYGLAKHWDVLVVTANSVVMDSNLEGAQKRGLTGAILCFDKGSCKATMSNVHQIENFFVPLLHTIARAVLLESAFHFHKHTQEIAEEVNQRMNHIDEMINSVRSDINNRVAGRTFGHELAMFWRELTFELKDQNSLNSQLSIENLGEVERAIVGESGIWHLPYTDERASKLKGWLEGTFSKNYPLLNEDEEFRGKFIAEISRMTGKKDWDNLFNSDISQKKLRVYFLPESFKNTHFTRLIFKPHLDRIAAALSSNFSEVTCNYADKNKFIVTVGKPAEGRTVRSINQFLANVKSAEGDGYFTKVVNLPRNWWKLYGLPVDITWGSDAAEKQVAVRIASNEVSLIRGSEPFPADFNKSTFCFHFKAPADGR